MEVVDVSFFFPAFAPLPYNILLISLSSVKATFKGFSELYFDERANNRWIKLQTTLQRGKPRRGKISRDWETRRLPTLISVAISGWWEEKFAARNLHPPLSYDARFLPPFIVSFKSLTLQLPAATGKAGKPFSGCTSAIKVEPLSMARVSRP